MVKIRTGFVSNSSSSSFILGVKKGTKLTPKLLMNKLFKIDKDSIFYHISEELAKIIIEYTKEDEWVKEVKENPEEYSDEFKRIKRLEEKGFKVYSGSADDANGGIEEVLCNHLGADYEDNEFYFSKEEGY